MNYVDFRTLPDEIEVDQGKYYPVNIIIQKMIDVLHKYPDEFIVMSFCTWPKDLIKFSRGETQEQQDFRHEQEEREERYKEYLKLKEEFEKE